MKLSNNKKLSFKNITYALCVFVLLTFVLWKGYVLLNPQQNKVIQTPPTSQTRVEPPQETDIIIGDTGARFKIVLFTDYECPFCHDVNMAIPNWLQQFGTSTFVFHLRHLPLSHIHPRATPFAIEVQCAKNLYGNQAAFTLGNFLYEHMNIPDEELRARYFEVSTQINGEAMQICREDGTALQQVEKHAYEALVNEINRTPSLFVYDSQTQKYIFKNPGGGAGLYTKILESVYKQNIQQ